MLPLLFLNKSIDKQNNTCHAFSLKRKLVSKKKKPKDAGRTRLKDLLFLLSLFNPNHLLATYKKKKRNNKRKEYAKEGKKQIN